MVRVGIAGIGFMGWIHWLAYQHHPSAQVVAIATPEPERRAGDWTGIKGNFGPPGTQVELTNVRCYATLDEMLADDQIDLIDLCLPPAMHADAVEAAARAGKHVFCEKPLALNLHDCNRALAACQQFGKMLMVGHVLPFFVEYAFVRQLVETNQLGKLLGGNFKRVISDPTWLQHFYDPKIVGGPLFDLHVHDAHFIRLLFGLPNHVQTVGRKRDQVVEYCHSIYHFEDPEMVVASTMGVIQQQGRPFLHGFEIHFEKGTVHFEFAALAEPHAAELNPIKIYDQHGEVHFPDLGDGDPIFAFGREIDEVIRSVESGTISPVLGGTLARDAIQICEMQADQILRDSNRS